MSSKIVTLQDKDGEVIIPTGVGKTNTKAEWFTVKLDKAADDTEKTFVTRNGGQYTFHCVNGATGWYINSSNREINIFRVRTEFQANGGDFIGAHGVKTGSTLWSRVYGDYKEGVGAQNKREGYYVVATGETWASVLQIGNPGSKLSGRLSYTMMRERAGGGWRCFCDWGSGYNVNWASLDIELTAVDENTGPSLYIRGVNNSNILNSFSVIDILEEL